MIDYESPVFSTREFLDVVGVSKFVYQIRVQRGIDPRSARHGRGVPRQHNFSDVLYQKFLKVASDAHVPLPEAAVAGLHLFPALEPLVPTEIRGIIRGRQQPDFFAVLKDGQAPVIVTKKQLVEASEGAAWFTAIDLSLLVRTTIDAAESVLAQRAT